MNMSTYIQVIDDTAAIFNDGDLVAAICLMDIASRKSDADAELLLPLIAEWQHACSISGPGVLDLRLNRVVRNHPLVAALVRLLDRLLADLPQGAALVPASLLNPWCRVPGLTFFDFPAADIEQAIHKLRDFVLLGQEMHTNKNASP